MQKKRSAQQRVGSSTSSPREKMIPTTYIFERHAKMSGRKFDRDLVTRPAAQQVFGGAPKSCSDVSESGRRRSKPRNAAPSSELCPGVLELRLLPYNGLRLAPRCHRKASWSTRLDRIVRPRPRGEAFGAHAHDALRGAEGEVLPRLHVRGPAPRLLRGVGG